MNAAISIPFAIGEPVWTCGPGHIEETIVCPECAGTRAIEMIKGNGEHISLECNYCQSSYDPPIGTVRRTTWRFEPMEFIPTNVRMDGMSEFSYSNSQYNFSAKNMWKSHKEAIIACAIKTAEYQKTEDRREIANLESKRRHLAFCSHYWKRKVTDLEASLIAARKRLAACKVPA